MLDWILGHLQAVMRAAMSAADAAVPAVPPEVSGLCAQLQSAASMVSPVTQFVPWAALAVGVGLWVLGLVAAVTIKLIRIGASFATLGGGSAA